MVQSVHIFARLQLEPRYEFFEPPSGGIFAVMPAWCHRLKHILAWRQGEGRLDGKARESVQQALSCRGWTDERKLAVLYTMVHATEELPGDILEIGSAWGRSTVLLGLASTKTIWSIDPHTGGVAYIQRGDEQDSLGEFLANLNRFGLNDRVQVLPHPTQKVQRDHLLPDDVRFSLVFIDGLHTQEGVTTDFSLAFKRLEYSGVLLFDDYFEPSVPDYTIQVDALCTKAGMTLCKDEKSKLVWYFKTDSERII